MTATEITLELRAVSKFFGAVAALNDVSVHVRGGEVLCLLGDNGAGKSTVIKIMSGVHKPSSGEIVIDGQTVEFASPRQAQQFGIAAVHQDDGTFPLMTVARNFFLGQEPCKGWGPSRRLDTRLAEEIAVDQLRAIGIRRVASGSQTAGTLSGGERQALSISRALYFGARLLILDEPTSSLGVKEAGVVLRLIEEARSRGIAIVFITHNVRHAMTVGDRFTVLIHGRVADAFSRGERSNQALLNLMAGGEELEALEAELGELRQAQVQSDRARS